VLTAAIVAAALVGVVVYARRVHLRTRALERRLAHESRSLESLQQAFARFAPSEVVESIIAQGISTRSETKEITVLFADLKDFTPLAEALEPNVLVTMLNGYFAAMGEVIAAHRGHLSKFIGDGLLALFGALEPNPWQTNDAVHAALAMQRALARYNESLAAQGLPVLAAGIGIHRGPVVAGVVGNAELVEYGVIGRTVNVASRVEGLTRVHPVGVLITDAVRAHLDARFHVRVLPAVEVKGLPEPLVTFAVDGFAGD
jgi:adenylate cyclase